MKWILFLGSEAEEHTAELIFRTTYNSQEPIKIIRTDTYEDAAAFIQGSHVHYVVTDKRKMDVPSMKIAPVRPEGIQEILRETQEWYEAPSRSVASLSVEDALRRAAKANYN